MTGALVGIYGVYFILVAYNGNAKKFFKNIETDIKGYALWIFMILILGALYENETTRPVVKPFITLAVLSFIVMNFDKLKTNLTELVK